LSLGSFVLGFIVGAVLVFVEGRYQFLNEVLP